MTSAGYLRFPHISSDLITFVAADDVWLAPATAAGRGGSPPIRRPRLAAVVAPAAAHLAWTSSRDGGPEVYVASVAEAARRRLTYWGAPMARVCGWTGAGEVLAISAAGQPFLRSHAGAGAVAPRCRAELGAERILPFGPVSDIAAGQAGPRC